MGSFSASQRVGFIGFGRKTFDMELAQQALSQSIEYLQQISRLSCYVKELVTDPGEVASCVAGWEQNVDVIVAQLTTFVDGRFIDELVQATGQPVIVWGVREPVTAKTQRLSLNSLTGANMAGHQLMKAKRRFHVVFGQVGEPQLTLQLNQKLRIEQAIHDMFHFTVAMVGDTPDGFDFSLPHPHVREQLNMQLVHLDLNRTFEQALALDDAVVTETLERVQSRVTHFDDLPRECVVKFAKMHQTLTQELNDNNAQAVAVRCWPEFFTEFGAAACSTVSLLTEEGYMGACEADICGALSMHILSRLASSPAYLGDLVEIDEATQSIVFWHCGAGAFSLARSDTGPQAGVHPNRKIGFTMEFGLKPGEVTIFRLGETADGKLRALIGSGEVLDEPQRFFGTSGKVRLDGEQDVVKRVQEVFEAGMEPHYALVYGNVVEELSWICRQFDIPVQTM